MMYIREDVIVTRTVHGEYRLLINRRGNYHLYWSLSPVSFSIDDELPVFNDEITVSDLAPGSRCYFHLTDNGYYTVATDRGLIQDGFSNLRDIGGYNTEDGKAFVTFGMLFRSEMPSSMTEDGISVIRNLHIKQILDFRSDLEEEANPHVSTLLTNYKRVSALKEDIASSGMKRIQEIIENPEIGLLLNKEFLDSYSRMFIHNDAFRMMFQFLLKGNTPLLFHCVNGKDRTGVAAALILFALGVPEETIIYDYMLTRVLCKKKIEMGVEKFRTICPEDERINEILTTFYSVREQAIQNTLQAIRSGYESSGTFFKEEMGLSQQDLNVLKKRYLIQHRNRFVP